MSGGIFEEDDVDRALMTQVGAVAQPWVQPATIITNQNYVTAKSITSGVVGYQPPPTSSTTSYYAPPAPPPPSAHQIHSNFQAVHQSYLGGGGQMMASISQFTREGWDALPPDQKNAVVQNSISIYEVRLKQILSKDLHAEIGANIDRNQKLLKEQKDLVDVSANIQTIMDGFAIPAYAINVEKVVVHCGTTIKPVANSVVLQKFGPNKEMVFGSVNKYGQGECNAVMVMGPNRVEIPRLLGNISNVFICQIVLSNIYSNSPYPIGVEFGEQNSSLANSPFVPYGSTRYVTPTGLRFHYIIPPKSNCDNKDVVVYVNSKEANHTFGFFYNWLTPDANQILAKNKMGNVGNQYLYPFDHPIPRYIATEGVKEGMVALAEPEEKYRGAVAVPIDLAGFVAERIANIVRLKLPTRNLDHFDIRYTVIDDKSAQVRQEADPLMSLAKLMRQTLKLADRVDQMDTPFGFHMSMLYLFRDRAEDINNPTAS